MARRKDRSPKSKKRRKGRKRSSTSKNKRKGSKRRTYKWRGRTYASFSHAYGAQVAYRKRKRGVKTHGSVAAWKRHERAEEDRRRREASSDRAEWAKAFHAKHGRTPSEQDWFVDYQYNWRDYYPKTASSTPSSRSSSLIEKLQALANDPGATPAERENARQRIREMS